MSDYSDSENYGICEECNQPNTGDYPGDYGWCKECNAKRFQQNFKNWTSGNDDIDKFIQHTQLSADNYREVLEWIPYDRFKNIEYIAKGGFGNVYKATWIDGNILYWDNKNKNWHRFIPSMKMALKSLNNSKNVTLEFINEITLHHKLRDTICPIIPFFGITQDPETKNYMMVLYYAHDGSLRNYLNSNKSKSKSCKSYSWYNKFNDLKDIAEGLNKIHEKDLIHRDLHIGNILYTSSTRITDMGLCKPADYKDNNTKKSIYGVLPYVAPEILKGQNYTKASDIYSFGIIMYEVFSELPPYHDISHNENLAMKICYGLRPRFNIKIPQLIVNLIKRCLDANPLNRLTATELEEILFRWYREVVENKQAEICKQIKEADEINKNLQSTTPSTSSGLSYETHSEAIYTSRLLNFNNLPEPKNSDDYYEDNDNLISTKFSESLKIDISQLKISDDTEEKK